MMAIIAAVAFGLALILDLASASSGMVRPSPGASTTAPSASALDASCTVSPSTTVTASSPAHSAIADLPVPARPPSETIPTSRSFSTTGKRRIWCSLIRSLADNSDSGSLAIGPVQDFSNVGVAEELWERFPGALWGDIPLYERGFQRLLNENQLGMLRPETLELYAKTCTVDAGTVRSTSQASVRNGPERWRTRQRRAISALRSFCSES